eukprot:6274264-Alexandrium_andersonii.AAC.1
MVFGRTRGVGGAAWSSAGPKGWVGQHGLRPDPRSGWGSMVFGRTQGVGGAAWSSAGPTGWVGQH